jgi:hypothetical protein
MLEATPLFRLVKSSILKIAFLLILFLVPAHHFADYSSKARSVARGCLAPETEGVRQRVYEVENLAV